MHLINLVQKEVVKPDGFGLILFHGQYPSLSLMALGSGTILEIIM